MSMPQRLDASPVSKSTLPAETRLELGNGLRLVYRALEPRMVFDAAMAATVAETAQTAPPAATADHTAAMTAMADTHVALAEALSVPSALTTGETFAFVDSRVQDFQSIVANLPAGTQVVVLNSETGGLEQIAMFLQGHHDVAAIQIFSHGTEAHLLLGNDVLDNNNLATHQAALTGIGQALSANGDILLYGCRVAGGAEGNRFISALASATGADVAASADDTGATALGGNWVLEASTGSIEAATVVAPDYDHLLVLVATNDTNTIAANATVAVTGNVLTNDTGTGTRTVIEVHGRATSVGTAYASSYGTITLNANGTYSYLVNTADSTIRSLTAGQTITDIIAYTARDGTTANPDYGYITVTITGINDPPIAFDNNTTVTPVAAPTASGNLITDNFPGNPADYIDRPQQLFGWTAQYTPGANVIGTTRTIGTGVNAVTVGITSTDPSGVNVAAPTANPNGIVQNAVFGGQPSYLQLSINPTGHAIRNPTTGFFEYTAPVTTLGFSQAVTNLEFTLVDVDTARTLAQVQAGAGSSWIDQVTITGTRNGVPVAFSAQFSGYDTRSGNSFAGNNITVANADAEGNIHVVFNGPVDNVQIAYNDGAAATGYTTGTFGNHVVGLSDLSWQSAGGERITQITSGSTTTPVTATGVTVPATYGSITVRADGSYTYNVDPNNAAVRALPAGATLIDNIPYTLSDTLGSTASATLRVTVNGLNDAPAGTDHVSGLTEDTPYTFAVADFGFTDPIDRPVDTFRSVVITTLPPASDGTLTLSGVAVTAGQELTVAQIASLQFIPALNRNGTGVGPFTFQVRDSGGIANGGVDLDPTPNVFRFTIAPVNDAPVAVNDLATTLEDTAITITAAALLANDTDVDSGDTRTLVSVQSPVNGTVALDAGGNPVFTPNANFTGTASYSYTVRDAAGLTSTATVSITVTPVNDAPAGTDRTVAATEDTPYSFAASDFGFTDPSDTPANALQSVVIMSLPPTAEGVLRVAGVPVTAGQELTAAQIATLTFTPAFNVNGANLGQFTFQVRDSGGIANGGVDLDPTPNVFRFTIAPVNDAPVAVNDLATTLEDTAITITAAALLANDTDVDSGDTRTLVSVQSPVNGTVALDAGGNPVFTPNANFTGTASYSYTIRDAAGLTSTAIVTITVTPVNDAPASTVPGSQTVAEDATLVFSGANAITLSDIDAGASGLETVKLSVTHGTLTLGSTVGITGLTGNTSSTVTFTGTIAAVNAAVNGLTYRGDANYNGPDLLTIAVLDDGRDNGAATPNGALPAMVRTVPINVTPVNDPPVAANDAAATNEDTAVTIPATALLGNDTDIDGDTLTITSVQNPVNGTVALDVAGNPVFTPAANYFGPASFTYSVSDGQGGSSTATVNVTIVSVNDAPVAANDAYVTGEDAILNVPLGTGLLANDSDIDGGALAVVDVNGNTLSSGAPVTLASGAILTLNGDGTFAYDPNGAFNALAAGVNGSDTFTYRVSDGNGAFATATATITIIGANDNPIANADNNGTSPRVDLHTTATDGLLANDTDVDGGALFVTSVNGTTLVGGQITVAGDRGSSFTIYADGHYDFSPGSLGIGVTENTSVTYTISDGRGGVSTSTLTITVPFGNLPPAVVQPITAQSSVDGGAISVPVTGVFADPNPADTLTITAGGLPPGLAYNPATGAIEGTLSANASQHAGPYLVTLLADDGNGGTVTSTFNFSVANVAPTGANDINNVAEHGGTTGAVLANDRDGGGDTDLLSVTQVNGAGIAAGVPISLPSGARLVITSAGTYSYDPNGAFDGLGVGQTAMDTFSYQISDGQGGTATAVVTITINGQNDTPVVIDPARPGVPPLDPTAIIPAQTGVDGSAISPLTVGAYFRDPDGGDTLRLSTVGGLPPGVTFNAATGTFSGTPTAAASQGGPAGNGVYVVQVVADDGHGGVASTLVRFTISNPSPTAGADSNIVQEHGITSGNVLSNDRDGGGDTDPLTLTQVNGAAVTTGATITLPSGALLVIATNGTYSYNPNGAFASLAAAQSATDTFTYQISDGQGGIATATATIVIQGQNDAPIAVADSTTTVPRVAISIDATRGVLANDTDAERDILAVTGVSNGVVSVGPGVAIAGTNGGTFSINADGSYAFDPGTAFDTLAPGTSGATSVTYAISDGHGGTSSTTLTVTVPFINLPPQVQAPVPAQNSLDGNTVSIAIGGVFADPNPGDVLTISATGLPPGLAYNPVTRAIEGTLAPDASQHAGPYVVVLTANDGRGGTVTSTFDLSVGNPVPIAVADTNAVTEHGTTTGAVLANDRDGGLDRDLLTVTQVNGAAFTAGRPITLPSGASLTLNANGTYGYSPNGAFNGLAVGQTATDSFTYQVADGQGGFATATVTLTITGQNDAPVIVDPVRPGTPIDPLHVIPTQSGADGSALIPLNVTGYFADPDTGDRLTLSVNPTTLPPGVTFTAATGTFQGTPTAVASQGGNAGPGLYDVVVTANDGNGGTVTTIVRFAITNPAPVAANDSGTVAEHATATGNLLANDRDGGGDSDPLSVTRINSATFTPGQPIALPSGAQLTIAANGQYTYDPNGAFPGLQVGQSLTDTFTYELSDGQGGIATATVTIVVTGENDAPRANPDVNITPARTVIAVTVPLGVLANDTDPENDPLAVTTITNGVTTVAAGVPVAGSNGGTFTINADGSYSFATGTDFDDLAPGTTDSTSVTYTISDGRGGTSTTTLTITVPFSNQPPVVNQPVAAQNSLDGNPVTIDVRSVFRDPNPGDSLTITATGLPTGLTYNPATGAIEGALPADASLHAGPYVVTLTATDLAGNAVSTTFTLAVGNPTPVAVNDTLTVGEHAIGRGDVTPATAGNDRDGSNDSDVLTVTMINGAAFTPNSPLTLPSGARLTVSGDGTYAYDPNGRFNGLPFGQSATDSFTYQISDGQGGTATATVSLTITGENDRPVVIDPANPGVPVAPGTQVVPTQTGLDGSPIAPLTIAAYFADPDRGDTVQLSVPAGTLPPGIAFDSATGTFTGTLTSAASQGGPAGNGVYPIVVTATDTNGLTTSTIVTFRVSNPVPVATADATAVLEHGTTSGNVLPNDRDGGADSDTLTVSGVNGTALPTVPGTPITLPSGALLVIRPDGTYTYDPNGAFVGLSVGETATDTFTYQVSDGQGGFATAPLTILITGENDAPVVIDPANPGRPPADPLRVIPVQTGSDGSAITPVTVTGFFRDPDAHDTLTLSVPQASLPPGITFDPATGTFSGVPTSSASEGGPAGTGVYPIVVTASDGNGGTVSTLITFAIANPPPVAVADRLRVAEHGPAGGGNVLTNDRDGAGDTDPISATQINGVASALGQPLTLPSGAVVTLNADGTYVYDPNGAFNGLSVGQTGTDTFTYQISDGRGLATATVTIIITGENDLPVVIDPARPDVSPIDPDHVIPDVTGNDGTPIAPISVATALFDPDRGDTLTYRIDPATLPPGLTFNPTTGVFVGTPAADASTGGLDGDGVYEVVVTASDGQGGTVATIVTFTFTNVPPVAVDDVAFAEPDQPVTIAVLGNDRDGGLDRDSLTVVAATASTGTVTINADGTLGYVPTPGFVGLATITYAISDGQGGTATATATVIVTPDIPVIAPVTVLPDAGGELPPLNAGITVEGAVLDAVQGIAPLNSDTLDLSTPGQGIDASGIILKVANQISDLGGSPQTLSGSRVTELDPRTNNPVWRLERILEREFGRPGAVWLPEGLTGFSLRYTFATDPATQDHAQLILDSIVRDRTLIVNLSSTSIPSHSRVVEYRVMQADGRPLPGWLDRVGTQVLMGEHPVDVEVVKLRIIAILSDGTSIERDVEIRTTTGEIQPLKAKPAAVVPLFSDQLRRAGDQGSEDFQRMLKALGGSR